MMNFLPHFAKFSIFGILVIAVLTGCQDNNNDTTTAPPPPTTSGFCYSLTASTSAYDTIVGGTVVNETNADDVFVINLDFPFTFCGTTFDNLYVSSNYGASFTYENLGGVLSFFNYELTVHGSALLEQTWGTLPDNSAGFISKLKYQTIGAVGNRVTTIEYRDFTYDDYSQLGSQDEYIVNFQIKLHENGNKISYHYGPSDLDIDFTQDQFTLMAIGLYSAMDEDGLFLSGDAANPTSNTTHLEGEVTTWPSENTMYLFQ